MTFFCSVGRKRWRQIDRQAETETGRGRRIEKGAGREGYIKRKRGRERERKLNCPLRFLRSLFLARILD